MNTALPGLGIVMALVAGGGNAVGGYLVTRAMPSADPAQWPPRGRATLAGLTQIGAGVLIAVALLEFVPTALSTLHPQSWAATVILLGYLFVHLVEHTLVPHFQQRAAASELASPSIANSSIANLSPAKPSAEGRRITPAGAYSVMAGLCVHSFFDGVAIGAAALLSATLGWLIFAAILMHKTPVGATIASVALSAGLGKRMAFVGASVVGSATVLGAVLVRPINQAQIGLAISLGAGVMLYVAATELIPAGNGQKKGYASAFVLMGVMLFMVTDYLIRRAGLQ